MRISGMSVGRFRCSAQKEGSMRRGRDIVAALIQRLIAPSPKWHELCWRAAAAKAPISSLTTREGVSAYNLIECAKIYGFDAIGINTNKLEIISTDKILIDNNKIHLPYKASGDIINNMALVYEDSSEVYTMYECLCSEDGMSAIFNSYDNLNGKYAKVSYLADKSK